MINKVQIRASRDGYTRGGLRFSSRDWTDVVPSDLSDEARYRILMDPVLILRVGDRALGMDERQALAVPPQALTGRERSEIRSEQLQAVVMSDADRIALTAGHEVLSWLDANDDVLRSIDPDLAEGEPAEVLAELVDRVAAGATRILELEDAAAAAKSTAAAPPPAEEASPAEATGGAGDDAPPAAPPRKGGGKAKGA